MILISPLVGSLCDDAMSTRVPTRRRNGTYLTSAWSPGWTFGLLLAKSKPHRTGHSPGFGRVALKQAKEIIEAGSAHRSRDLSVRRSPGNPTAASLLNVVGVDEISPFDRPTSSAVHASGLGASLRVDGRWRQHEKEHSQCASIPQLRHQFTGLLVAPN